MMEAEPLFATWETVIEHLSKLIIAREKTGQPQSPELKRVKLEPLKRRKLKPFVKQRVGF